jgi:phthalate 4,5-dioxygenase oxygenase subunit
MFTAAENDILSGVGPGKPLNAVLSKYWFPVGRAADLADHFTLRVRLLGENWVVARRGSDLIALEEHCPHRQASLALARVEECGLRCIYHGWLIGDDGSVLESPNESNSQGRRNASVRAIGVKEDGGVLWLNVEPDPAKRAPFPNLPFFGLPTDHVAIAVAREKANWLQAVEGAIDSSHSSFLHSDEIISGDKELSTEVGKGGAAKLVRPSADVRPRIRVSDTNFGFIYGALRTPNENPDKEVYVRATPFAMPAFVGIPAADMQDHTLMWAPNDDLETTYVIIKSSPFHTVDQMDWEDFTGLMRGRDLDEDGYLRATLQPGWGQDREAMKEGRSYTGMHGVNFQDFVVQQSMGPIVDRAKEHLGPGDRAIIHLRRMLLDAAEGKGFGSQERIQGIDYSKFKARDGLIPIDQDWQNLYADDDVQWLGRT